VQKCTFRPGSFFGGFMPAEIIQDAKSQDGVWNADGSLPADLDPDGETSSGSQENAFPGTQEEESTPTEALKPEQESDQDFQDEGETEMQEQGEEETKEPPFHTHPRWQEMVQRQKETQSQLAELQAQLQQAQDMASFYATQYNDAVGLGQLKKQEETGRPPGQEAQESVQALDPEKWSTQTDFANYAKAQVRGLEQSVTQNMTRLAEQLGGLMEYVIKNAKPDYDEAMKATYEDLFHMDPDGKATARKNEALFNYFNAHVFPHLAMYEHGQRKLAPNRIKQGVQTATKKALQQLGKKPTGPTKPGTGTGKLERAKSIWNTQDAWKPQPDKRIQKELRDAGL